MTNAFRRRLARHRAAGRNHAIVLVLLLVVLSACGPATSNDDRRFASSTQPPRPTVASPRAGTPAGTPVDQSAIEPLATPDPARLLTSDARANAGFFLSSGRLLVAHVDGTVRDVTLPGPASAISVAPNGTTAAVLVSGAAGTGTPSAATTPDGRATPTGATGAVSVVIVDARGEFVRTVDDVMGRLVGDPEAADALAGETTIVTIGLGPNIDDLIVAFADGLLVRVPTKRAVAVIPGSGNLADVRQVSWAPNGRALAVVAAGAAGELPAIYYTPLRADGIDLVRIAPAAGRTTDRVAWLPDASGVVFTDAAGPLDAVSLRSGRDLFVTPLRSDRRTLVAAAGVIGPAAGVVDIAVAPGDGQVAYTLYRAEGDQVRFNSLWVGPLDGNGAIQIALPALDGIDGLAWTAGGLLILAEGVGGGGPEVLLVGPDGVVAAPAPAATPAA